MDSVRIVVIASWSSSSLVIRLGSIPAPAL
jgi:hypothetical protein